LQLQLIFPLMRGINFCSNGWFKLQEGTVCT
jgi:hypothetical protein